MYLVEDRNIKCQVKFLNIVIGIDILLKKIQNYVISKLKIYA